MTIQSKRAVPLTCSFRPCILVSETHHPFLGEVGVFANALERIARYGFYGAAGIAGVPDGGERRQIADIVTTSGLSLTYWTSFVLVAQHLNLSALDPELRARSVSTIKRQMDDALECGASALGVLSGPDPGPAARPAALEALCDSLRELATAGANRLTVVIEPLDREIHKKGLLGPMSDSVAVLDKVAATAPAVKLGWDSGHVTLNKEQLADSLALAKPFISEVHISNPVLDAASPSFGDSHIPLGSPGRLTLDGMATILRLLRDAGLLARPELGVAVEIRTPPGGDPWTTERMGRDALLAAMERICSEGQST